MNHLTDEQFEDLLQGGATEPAHLAECRACRDRLAEHRAVRARLRSSFASVRADAALAERIRRSVGEPRPAAAPRSLRRPSRVHHLSRFAWAGLAAAAAVIVAAAIPAILYFTAPSMAVAAQAELVRIHEGNLAAHHEFYTDADPAKLADYLKTHLGFEPATPRLGQGMAMRGCCVAYFRGSAAGSYVVDTPRGPISIIVVPQTPESLGLGRVPGDGRTCWAGAFATNHIVAVRLGDYSYCAVGEVPQDLLTAILLDLGLAERS